MFCHRIVFLRCVCRSACGEVSVTEVSTTAATDAALTVNNCSDLSGVVRIFFGEIAHDALSVCFHLWWYAWGTVYKSGVVTAHPMLTPVGSCWICCAALYRWYVSQAGLSLKMPVATICWLCLLSAIALSVMRDQNRCRAFFTVSPQSASVCITIVTQIIKLR